jgi:hypothetical protein
MPTDPNPCIAGLSPTALKIASAMPKPNLPGLASGTSNNLNNVVQNYAHGNQGDIKVDWAPTSRDRVFAVTRSSTSPIRS